MIAGDEVIVIRDTVDVREMAQNRLAPVAAGEFGRVLRTEGRFVVIAMDGRVVMVDRNDITDMGDYSIRLSMERRRG